MSTPKKTKTAAGVAPAKAAPPIAEVAPDTMDWSNYEGQSGYENVSQDDLGIPFINIIQTKSAEVDKTHKDYATKKIEGCEAGDIVNSVTRSVLAKVDKGSIVVIPCFYEKTYVEWKQNRGGMVKVHRNPAIMDEVTGMTEKKEPILRNGNIIMETASFYVMVVDGTGEKSAGVINMASSNLKNARLWLNLALGIKVGPNRVTPPLFSHHYVLSTHIERKDNNAWYAWTIQVGDMVKDRETAQQAIGIGDRVRRMTNVKPAQIENTPVVEAEEVPM